MNKTNPLRLTDDQILQSVRDVEEKGFGRAIIKVRHGVACFIEKELTEQVKPEPQLDGNAPIKR